MTETYPGQGPEKSGDAVTDSGQERNRAAQERIEDRAERQQERIEDRAEHIADEQARAVRWEAVRSAFHGSSALWAGAVVLVSAIGFGAMGMQTYVTIQRLPATVQANTMRIDAEAQDAREARDEIDRHHVARMDATDSLVGEVVRTQRYLVCRDDPTIGPDECARLIFR